MHGSNTTAKALVARFRATNSDFCSSLVKNVNAMQKNLRNCFWLFLTFIINEIGLIQIKCNFEIHLSLMAPCWVIPWNIRQNTNLRNFQLSIFIMPLWVQSVLFHLASFDLARHYQDLRSICIQRLPKGAARVKLYKLPSGQQKVREHGSGALRKWQTKLRKWCKLGKKKSRKGKKKGQKGNKEKKRKGKRRGRGKEKERWRGLNIL